MPIPILSSYAANTVFPPILFWGFAALIQMEFPINLHNRCNGKSHEPLVYLSIDRK